MQSKNINKHGILVIFKKTNQKFLFSSIKKFVDIHPQWPKSTLYNYTSRKKIPYEDGNIILEKIPFFRNDIIL